ncbi:Mothers against decapentaplegic-like protein [Aphelenchoides besseyi]|nr:Mothers against decapentaplegic-like protein [Aphelenchoides besseyi]KAI6201016.1 Mothers against decapentaplegic-like protein [Aphelenchoides besseyi]
MNIFSALDPAVKKLLGWKLGDEEEKWAFKAVESLVKKLRKKKAGVGTVEDLEFALAHPGVCSKCVTIPRSLDGRLQVSHRKGLPHVIYCRVWRWPNLQSHHELKAVPECRFPYDNRSENICINPYHYQRLDSEPRSPAVVAQMQGSMMPSPGQHSATSSILHHPPNAGTPNQNFYTPSSSPYNLGMCQSNVQKLPNGPGNIPSNFNIGNQQDMMETQFASPYSAVTLQSPMQSNSVASPSVLSDDDDFLLQCQGPVTENCLMGQIENWPEPDYWCTICYYELNSRVGEPFKLAASNVVVDGFTDPSQEDNRICLGLLSNVNRNITIENTRRHIGKGVRFVCTDSVVTINNLSQSPVFVQSRNSNFKYNLQATSVCRVPAGSSIVIFDYKLFHNMLQKAKSEGYHHVYELQKMCFIRLSFVKGWGADYHRQDVTSTPCWLEIQLHQPLSWIDSVITPMDPPEHLNITSVS